MQLQSAPAHLAFSMPPAHPALCAFELNFEIVKLQLIRARHHGAALMHAPSAVWIVADDRPKVQDQAAG